MTRSLNGKVAVITGAGSGMGRSMALRLAEDNARIAIWDINGAGAEETAKMVRDAGGTAIAIEADCSDKAAIKAAAETFRINPDLDVATVITELKVGEALVSTLNSDGSPSIVQRTLIAPPRSRLGPVSDKERAIIQSISPHAGKYDTAVNRESAAEVLQQKAADAAAAAQMVEQDGAAAQQAQARQSPSLWGKAGRAAVGAVAASAGSVLAAQISGRKSRASPVASGLSAVVGTVATQLGGAAFGRFARRLLGGLLR
jgi:hypothetical protein